MTRLAGTLPGGDANGLVAIARQLIDEPHAVHVAIVLIDCKSSKVDHDSGEIVPTARIRRVEVIGEQDTGLAQKMMRRALEERTGKTVLPFDLEEDMRSAFGNVDPHTGEILGD